MVVLEAPIWHDWPVAGLGPERYGYLVFFRLDLQACVASLEDEEASRAAALLPQDWFAGIILSTGALDVHNEKDQALLNFSFSLVGEGLPDHAPASVAIGTSPPFLADRPSMSLDQALPWPNLYVHTYYNALTIISRIHHGTGFIPPCLDAEQLLRLRKTEVTDKYHRRPSPIRDVDSELQSGSAANDTGSSDHGTDDLPSDDVRPIYEILDNVNLYVDLWLDPKALTGTPAPPRAYDEVVRGLRRIWHEWGDRQLSAVKAKHAAVTDEWIRAVDKAQSEQPPASVHSRPQSSLEQPLGDDAILPEDAIDYRAEQDMLSRRIIRPRAEAPVAVTSTTPQADVVPHPGVEVVTSSGSATLSPDFPATPATDLLGHPATGSAAAADPPSSPDGGALPSSGRVTLTPTASPSWYEPFAPASPGSPYPMIPPAFSPMPVIESPRCDGWPLPTRGPERFGHCFLFRLDPAASVAALRDAEATRAAALIPRDWFLGVTLADGGTELYASDGMKLVNFKFCLISTALPTDFQQGAVPIAPLEPLVADRPSLDFVPALHSEEGFYVHTCPSRAAVVSRVHDTSEKPLATLSPQQHEYLRECQLRDEYRRGTFLFQKYIAEQEAKRAAKLAASPSEGNPALDTDAQSSISSASGSYCDSEISDIRYLLTEEMQTRFLQARIFVEVWSDPIFHAGPPTDPAKFEEATAQDWKERMLKETLAKRPQTEAWLQGVERVGDEEVEDRVQGIGPPLDDDAVLPEDAVDSRLENANIGRRSSQRIRDWDDTVSTTPKSPPGVVSASAQLAAPQISTSAAVEPRAATRCATESTKEASPARKRSLPGFLRSLLSLRFALARFNSRLRRRVENEEAIARV
ncbi:hypothetical protein AURDEDRAFT_128503 [Auricularia subglabra TFB-10046 SS5]|uniref:Uncharacterized protein n=1 Tax=Auricularia subglabra (strain TFB-10046 / SS5) TaxID=717982 RepID=J0D153_AURST|nr:hypothetical protein AURDEDRAFT_128503 [Auricularia subglabra TFB-10046 SS5]